MSVSTSTSLKSSLNFSLCSTPNRCSSSITTSPRSLKTTSPEISRCVPITISTPPLPEQLAGSCVCSPWRTETAQHFDAHRSSRACVARNTSKCCWARTRGGREHGHLFAVHHRFERGANCYFGLAEADVAADQPVHGTWPFHVAFAFDDRLELVGSFAKWKRMFEFHLPLGVRAKCVSALRFAFRL